MFKIEPNPTFTAKVPLSIPGQTRPGTIDIEFRHLGKPQIKAFFEGLEGKTDTEALGEVIVGWKGVDMPYDATALELLLSNYPAAGGEIFEAFRKELLEAKAKN